MAAHLAVMLGRIVDNLLQVSSNVFRHVGIIWLKTSTLGRHNYHGKIINADALKGGRCRPRNKISKSDLVQSYSHNRFIKRTRMERRNLARGLFGAKQKISNKTTARDHNLAQRNLVKTRNLAADNVCRRNAFGAAR